MDFIRSNERRIRAQEIIPGGAHTYSKGDDQFAQVSPHSIVRGKGARVWDVDGNEFVDWGMGLTSVLLGHAYTPVIEAVAAELKNGSNFIRPSWIELELAETFCQLIPCAEMVKFAKNGSDATTAAVKLARAYTGRDIILRCLDQPFFAVNDWFMGNTVVTRGIPKSVQNLTRAFRYNDLDHLQCTIEEADGQVACVILEPASVDEPSEGFLEGVKKLCHENGIVLIFDEVITGFRFHPQGAQTLYGVTPDLATFGKAMGNGFSVSAVAGKRDIMRLGGIDHDEDRVFLLSTTHGGETHHLRAAQKTIEILIQNEFQVTRRIWEIGRQMREGFNTLAADLGISQFAEVCGLDCRPYFSFLDKEGNQDSSLRTLFVQEMIQEGVLVQSLNPSFSHGESEIDQTLAAFAKVLRTLSNAIADNKVSKLLIGDTVKPVFRRRN